MRIAEQVGGEILSVDSMQVYRKMDIGTAKPTSEEQSRVKHHLIDLVDPSEIFTVARFVELADAVIKDASARNVPIIAVGGTPLYYKALFEGMFEGPGESAELRLRLRGLTNEELHKRLVTVDPQASTRIHQNDTRRLIRALEVHELTGKPISSFQTEWTEPTKRHQAKWFGIEWDRELLNRRINARVKQMLEAGWLDETRTLLKRIQNAIKNRRRSRRPPRTHRPSQWKLNPRRSNRKNQNQHPPTRPPPDQVDQKVPQRHVVERSDCNRRENRGGPVAVEKVKTPCVTCHSILSSVSKAADAGVCNTNGITRRS